MVRRQSALSGRNRWIPIKEPRGWQPLVTGLSLIDEANAHHPDRIPNTQRVSPPLHPRNGHLQNRNRSPASPQNPGP